MDVQPNPAPSGRRTWLTVVAVGLIAAGAASGIVALRHSTMGPQPPARRQSFGDGAPPVGRPAPEFALPLFNGGTLSLRSLRGKPVLLNFWASWCVPCREEMPLLVRLHKVYAPRGVAFVGVDTEDQEAAARAFIAQYHVEYAVVKGVDERLIDAYAIPGLPTTVFIGADGIVKGKVVGGFVGPEGGAQLVERLNLLIADSHR